MKLITFTVLSILGHTLSISVKKPSLRVIDGRNALPGEYPYAVRLEAHISMIFENETKTTIIGGCSGAAIATTWTLTANHCFSGKTSSRENKTNYILETKVMIRYGNPHLKPSENKQVAAILKIKRPQVIIKSLSPDIALLLNDPILINDFAKISAIDHRTFIGHEVAVVGFGMMRMDTNAYAFNHTVYLDKPLQIMEAVLITCESKESYEMLCALPPCRTVQTPYYGDSGGPVVHASGIMGVITKGSDSFSQRARPNRNHVAKNILKITTVSPYLEWIYSEMQTMDN